MGYEVDENDVRVCHPGKARKTSFSAAESDFVDEDDEILDLEDEIDSTEK